jgi:hypothetical protein
VQSPSGQLGYWLAQRTLQERPDIAPPVVAEAAPLSAFTQRRIGGRQVATARASLGKPVAVEMVLAFWLQDRRLQGLRCAHRQDGSGAVAARIEALLAAPPAAAP